MSTLPEIEAAVAALPEHEQEALLLSLTERISSSKGARAKLVMENGRPVLVAPPGAPKMTPELVKELLADFP